MSEIDLGNQFISGKVAIGYFNDETLIAEGKRRGIYLPAVGMRDWPSSAIREEAERRGLFKRELDVAASADHLRACLATERKEQLSERQKWHEWLVDDRKAIKRRLVRTWVLAALLGAATCGACVGLVHLLS